jgi:hypothetical protein
MTATRQQAAGERTAAEKAEDEFVLRTIAAAHPLSPDERHEIWTMLRATPAASTAAHIPADEQPGSAA